MVASLETALERAVSEGMQILTGAHQSSFLSSIEAWEKHHARPKQLMPEGDYRVFAVMSGRGWGKMLDIHTPIATPDGWKAMGDLRAGDRVFDEGGEPCRVTWCSPVEMPEICYAVRFDDGAVINACSEHQWFTDTKASRKSRGRRKTDLLMPQRRNRVPSPMPAVRTTEEIRQTLRAANSKEVNHSIPCTEPLVYEDSARGWLPIDPYVLGAWLGDGSSSGAEITCEDDQILAEIAAAGYGVKEYRTATDKARRYGIAGLRAGLKEGGLLGNKHVPLRYLMADVQDRLDLLRGFMDTDGTVSKTGACEFTSTNPALADAVYELVVGLGMKAGKSEHRAMLRGHDTGPKWRVRFTPYLPVFRLARKLKRQRFDRAQAERKRTRYVVAVDCIPSIPMRCITVDSPSSLYLAGRECIPTHNTRTASEAVKKHGLLNPGARVAVCAPTYAHGRDVCFEEPDSGILGVLPIDAIRHWNRSIGELYLTNGSYYRIVSADVKRTGRGPQWTMLWGDEVQEFQYPETWHQLMLGLRRGTEPKAIATFTPKPVKLVRDIVESPDTVVVQGSTYENRANLAPNVFREIMERYEGTSVGRQEIYGELLSEMPGSLWPRALLEECRADGPPIELDRVVVAVDPAGTESEEGSETGIVVAGKANGPSGATAYVLADRSGYYSPDRWASEAVNAYETYDADAIVAEVNQGGDMVRSIIKRARDYDVNVRTVRAKRGKALRAEPVVSLYEQRKVRHAGELAKLEDQMASFTLDEAPLGTDRVDALVYAVSELMLKSKWKERALTGGVR